MASLINNVAFTPTAGSTTDWTYSAAVQGYNTPAQGGVVNSATYRYHAFSADHSQWEIGYGTYNTGTGVLARTTVLYNSSATGTASGQSGAGSKINFSVAPTVIIVALYEDLLTRDDNLSTLASASAARTNLGLVIGTDVAAIASPTFTGTPAAPTAAAGTSTTQLATTAFVKTNSALKGQINGLTLSNNGADAVNDIDIAVGEAASTETNPVLMVLGSALTKRLDATWAVGTGQGGLDTGSIADHDGTSTTSLAVGTGSKVFTTQSGKAFLAGEWVYAYSAGSPSNAMWGIVSSYSGTTLTLTVYQTAGSGTFTDWTLQQETSIHVFLIQRSDTGVVDVLFSLSPSAPTMPGSGAYDRKRLIMSFIRTQGTIKAFTQYGDMVKYALARFVWNSAAVQSNFLLRQAVPSGTNIVPLIDANLQVNAAGTAILLIDDGDRSAANYAVARAGLASEWSIIHSVNFITNTAGQLRFETVIGGTVNQIQLKNLGYIHSRGR